MASCCDAVWIRWYLVVVLVTVLVTVTIIAKLGVPLDSLGILQAK